MGSDEPLQILTQLRQGRYRVAGAHLSRVLLNLFCEIYVSWQESVLTPRSIRRQERQQENGEGGGGAGGRKQTFLTRDHGYRLSTLVTSHQPLTRQCDSRTIPVHVHWVYVLVLLLTLKTLVVIFFLCNNQHTPELLSIKQAASCEMAEYFHLLSSQTIRQTRR